MLCSLNMKKMWLSFWIGTNQMAKKTPPVNASCFVPFCDLK